MDNTDICMMILEYAAKYQHIEVFHVLFEDKERTPLQDILLAPTILYQIVSSEGIGRFELAATLLHKIYEHEPACCNFRKFSRLLLGIKMKMLLEILRADSDSALAQLNKHIPREGFCYHTKDKQGLNKMNTSAKEFRKFYLPLILETDQRNRYYDDEYEAEFGGSYMESLKKLTKSVLSTVISHLPPCRLEVLITKRADNPEAASIFPALKILSDFIKVTEKLDGDTLMKLLKLLYDQDQLPGRVKEKMMKSVTQSSSSRMEAFIDDSVFQVESILSEGNNREMELNSCVSEELQVKDQRRKKNVQASASRQESTEQDQVGKEQKNLQEQTFVPDISANRKCGEVKVVEAVKDVVNVVKDSRGELNHPEFHTEPFYAKKHSNDKRSENTTGKRRQVHGEVKLDKSLRSKKLVNELLKSLDQQKEHEPGTPIRQTYKSNHRKRKSRKGAGRELKVPRPSVVTRSRKRQYCIGKENDMTMDNKDIEMHVGKENKSGSVRDKSHNKQWIRAKQKPGTKEKWCVCTKYKKTANAIVSGQEKPCLKPAEATKLSTFKLSQRQNRRSTSIEEPVVESLDNSDESTSTIFGYGIYRGFTKSLESPVAKVTRLQKVSAKFLIVDRDKSVTDKNEGVNTNGISNPCQKSRMTEGNGWNLLDENHNLTSVLDCSKNIPMKDSTIETEFVDVSAKSKPYNLRFRKKGKELQIYELKRNTLKNMNRVEGNQDNSWRLETDKSPDSESANKAPCKLVGRRADRKRNKLLTDDPFENCNNLNSVFHDCSQDSRNTFAKSELVSGNNDHSDFTRCHNKSPVNERNAVLQNEAGDRNQSETGNKKKFTSTSGAPDDDVHKKAAGFSKLFSLDEIPKLEDAMVDDLVKARCEDSEISSIIPPSERSKECSDVELHLLDESLEFEDNKILETLPDIRKFLHT